MSFLQNLSIFNFKLSSKERRGIHRYYLKTQKLKNSEVQKSKALILVEIIEYVPSAVVIKNIMKKTTGTVTAISVDSGEDLIEKVLPFDKFIQIIEGSAQMIIDGSSHSLETGQGIIVPAHSKNTITANERFKMISTIIKSGYE